MKFKAVIEKRIPNRKVLKKKNKLLMVIIIVLDIFLNTLLPFTLGVYFFMTKHLIFIAILFILLFFNVNFEIDKRGNVNIKFVRGL